MQGEYFVTFDPVIPAADGPYRFPFSKPIAPGIDPIIGQSPTRSTGGLDPLDQTKTFSVPLFVIPKGGEYFFMPSISALTSTIAA